MSQLLNTKTDLKSHAEHFVERYERLLGWALHLTDHDRAQAEDLLHDAFIQFTLAAPDLDDIRNLDNYLFGVLRILRVSQLRRASRRRFEQLSIIEYESAEIGLSMASRAAEPGELIRVRDELRAICQYACARKETSKAGSVLILRFFHGYYPSEIAAVLRSTRKVVDMRLQSARREARLYCSAPERLGFIKTNNGEVRTKPGREDSIMAFRTADNLLQELRSEIFSARTGECFSQRELKQMYESAGEGDALENRQLGHIVSCATCLDQVNRILGLPVLADRHPNDTLGGDKRGPGDGNGGGGSGAGGDALKLQAERRARDIFEHRPQELFVAVNGFLLGSQTIYGEWNEQSFELDLAEPPSFVEVFSEQGLRLSLMPIDLMKGEYQQTTKLAFSDGRELALSLHGHDPYPTLNIAYHDPLMNSQEVSQFDAVSETDFALNGSPHFSVLRPAPPFAQRLLQFGQAFFASHSRWRLTLATATLALLVAIGLLWRWPSNSTVSAAELLQRSIAAETQVASSVGQATHFSFRIEERDSSSARLVSTHRIEIWQSADRGLAVRRLYDAQNRLIAAEWKQADGTRRLYSQKNVHALGAQNKTEIPQELWQTALAPRSFANLVETATATVREREDTYILDYQFSADASPQLIRASLTLKKPDLRAIEQTAILRLAADGGRQREFHVVETGFQQLPAGKVLPEVFEPDAELALAEERRSEAASNSKLTGNQAAIIPAAKAANLTALEIEARYLLDQVNANLGEQVSVTREGHGLRVGAMVETDKRKAELISALSPLSANPAATLDIVTYAEAARRQSRPTASSTVSEFQAARNQIPAAADLRRYFSAQNENRVDVLIAELANRIQTQAMKPLRHARALRALVEQIPTTELDGLEPEAKTKWRRMVQSHALAIARETKALRAELQPIFFAAMPQGVAVERSSEQSLRQAVERLTALAANHDEIVSRAFSGSVASADASALKSPQFRLSLLEAELLAESIAKQK